MMTWITGTVAFLAHMTPALAPSWRSGYFFASSGGSLRNQL